VFKSVEINTLLANNDLPTKHDTQINNLSTFQFNIKNAQKRAKKLGWINLPAVDQAELNSIWFFRLSISSRSALSSILALSTDVQE